jgi:hypothetical protein
MTEMKSFVEFMGAASPRIAMGMLLAVCFARSVGSRKGKDQQLTEVKTFTDK